MRRTVFAVFVMLMLSGCCSCPDVQEALKDGIAINQGHVNDAGLPQEARDIALDNSDLLYDVRYRTGGIGELPADVRERKDARAAAATGGGE